VSLTYHIGDTLELTRQLPDASVDLIVTSPPFLALRSYLPADHPDKHKEIGSEPTPADFIDTLLGLTGEWLRVLAPHGSICVELGDTYSGSKGQDDGVTIDYHRPNSYGSATITRTRSAHNKNGNGWPLAKSLTGIPTLYTWSLAYGRNRSAELGLSNQRDEARASVGLSSGNGFSNIGNPAGAPPLDWHADDHPEDGDWLWKMSTQPYRGSHYATFPMALPKRLIEAMCPLKVCAVCGVPSERIAETTNAVGRSMFQSPGRDRDSYDPDNDINKHAPDRAERLTLGWTDCGHDNYRTGVVLDPFAGSGTTLEAAQIVGRHAIGFDLDDRNADLARERVGMFLEIVA
jgi:site-specific DNA-methyltransferase (adenine-specific)